MAILMKKNGSLVSVGSSSKIEVGITPTGNINITDTNQTDVTNYATAQVVDANLIAENIKKDVTILGITGTFQGGRVVFDISTTLTDVTGAVNNPTIIEQNGTATLKFTGNTGFNVPDTIQVTGASSSWSSATGILVLSNPTANVIIQITGEAVPDSTLENNTWLAIKKACERNDPILSTWLGQTKSTTYNGLSTSFRLVDTYTGRYKFDDNSDSHGVFEMVDTTKDKFYWDSGSSGNGYANSYIKNTYDNTYYNYLANDLKSILKNTTVKSIKGGGGSSGSTVDATNCKIFPASVVEMFGTTSFNNYVNETNGGQFNYYVGKSDSDRIKNNVSGSTARDYWLRSPYSSHSVYSNCILANGNNTYTNITTTLYGSVCFAF